ncbi:MAG: DUF2141 domain-containing protein [Chitinophagaceae bacterium]|nr:DUF2141 domain-containing protein [Chitinophagaceae bacterium]
MNRFYRYFLLSILLLVAATVISRVTENKLSLSITDLRNNKGHVLITVYKDGIGYPEEVDKAVRRAKLTITNKTATVSFAGFASGNYAIAILHDENDDGKMNSNFLGLPKEGYGFSNNVMGNFGPPSFSKASFLYNANQSKTISIKARY